MVIMHLKSVQQAYNECAMDIQGTCNAQTLWIQPAYTIITTHIQWSIENKQNTLCNVLDLFYYQTKNINRILNNNIILLVLLLLS